MQGHFCCNNSVAKSEENRNYNHSWNTLILSWDTPDKFGTCG